jgi:hypothetical protein
MTANIYWQWKQSIPESVCETMLSEMKNFNFRDAKVADASHITEDDADLNIEHRKSKVTFLPANHWFEGILYNYVRYANVAAGWNYDIRGNEAMQYTMYEKDGLYDWHTDQEVYNVSPIMRKLSVVCQLNKSSEFTGGGLFYKNADFLESEESLLKEQGDVVVMPSYVLHKAKEIMSGRRITLVLWAIGPSWV